MVNRRKTAGELSLKAKADSSRYKGVEVAEAQMHDLYKQLMENAHAHLNKIDEPEFFVVMVRASDPLIEGVVRQKFYSYPYMPSPRPEQAVFLYNKVKDELKFIWSLPPAKVMAAISEATGVAKHWVRTKAWCDAFFDGNFWKHIRQEHKFDHLSEIEYLKANREKLIKAGCKEVNPFTAESFDFSKVSIEKIIDTKDSVIDENLFNGRRKAESLNRNVSSQIM